MGDEKMSELSKRTENRLVKMRDEIINRSLYVQYAWKSKGLNRILVTPLAESYLQQMIKVREAKMALLQALQPQIKAQISVLKAINFQPFYRAQQKLAEWIERPETILAMALLRADEKDALTQALSKLLKKLETGAVITGDPPRLIILDETLTYEEILALEGVLPKNLEDLKKMSDGTLLNVVYRDLIRVIRNAKARVFYLREQEVKRQSSNFRYQEVSLESLVEPGHEDLEDKVLGKVVENISFEQTLRELEQMAR